MAIDKTFEYQEPESSESTSCVLWMHPLVNFLIDQTGHHMHAYSRYVVAMSRR